MNGKHGTAMARFSADHPGFVTWVMAASMVLLMALAGLPSVWPDTFRPLNPVAIDTDPENMLPADQPVRVFHNAMKREFSLYDMVVVGIVNETHPDGVFNVESLRRIHELTAFAVAYDLESVAMTMARRVKCAQTVAEVPVLNNVGGARQQFPRFFTHDKILH